MQPGDILWLAYIDDMVPEGITCKPVQVVSMDSTIILRYPHKVGEVDVIEYNNDVSFQNRFASTPEGAVGLLRARLSYERSLDLVEGGEPIRIHNERYRKTNNSPNIVPAPSEWLT